MRPIHISTSPNLEWDDVVLAGKLLMGKDALGSIKKVENWFNDYFGEVAISFNSGRSALWGILKALGVGRGDEVMIQSFTCVVVPNSITWLGANPVYVDISADGFNMNPNDLIKKLTKKTKAVIYQHSFGMGEGIEKVKEICKQRGIFLIEDCALSLGATRNGKKLGTFGDAAIFSFGRDKVLSSVFGGIAIVKDKNMAEKFISLQNSLPEMKQQWIRQQLRHPILTWFALETYKYGIGKAILQFGQRWGFLSKAIYEVEKHGGQPEVFPGQWSEELAALALQQLGKLDRFNNRRQEITEKYFANFKNLKGLPNRDSGAIYLRFPLLVNNTERFMQKTKESGWFLDRWYENPVMPAKNMEKIGYAWGDCPRAENIVKKIVNLPTYPLLSNSQVDEVITKTILWLK